MFTQKSIKRLASTGLPQMQSDYGQKRKFCFYPCHPT